MTQTGAADTPPGPPGLGASAAPGTAPPGRTTAGPPAAPSRVATAPAAAGPAGTREPLAVRHTRASATYLGVAVGLVILVLIIIFIAQNLHEADVHFLGSHFRLAEGLIILASAVAGGLIVLLVSLVRVVQLRRMARRHRQAHAPS